MTLHLHVKPGNRVDQLFYNAAGVLTLKLKAPAQEGRANAYLIDFLAKQLGISKSDITLESGFTHPHKRLAINADEVVIRAKLELLPRV